MTDLLVHTPALPTVTRVVPIVEIGVGSVNAPGGDALWQTSTPSGSVTSRWQPASGGTDSDHSRWSGKEPYYVDVSCHVREVSTFTGRERSIDLWEVGTATITVDNVGGWADYPRSGDPNQLLVVQPGRHVRVGVLVDGVDVHHLWTGFIDAMEPGYHPEDGEFVTLECIDAKGEAGRGFVAEVTAAVGAGETSSARATRILNAAGWPAWRRDIQSNAVTLKGTLFGEQAVDLLNLAADSSGGACFGDLNANVAFRQRDWQATSNLQTPDGVISNFPGDELAPVIYPLVESPAGSGLYDPTGFTMVTLDLFALSAPGYELVVDGDGLYYVAAVATGGPVCPTEWELSFNREDISTRVVVGRFDDADQTPPIAPVQRDDVPGQNLFGVETFERTDLETVFAADLALLADRIKEVRSYQHMPRISAVHVDAGADESAVDLLAVVTPFKPSVIDCRHRGTDGRIVIDKRMMVVGIEHLLSPEGWSARIALDNVKPFLIEAENGRWNAPGGTAGYWQPTPPTGVTAPAIVTTWSPGV